MNKKAITLFFFACSENEFSQGIECKRNFLDLFLFPDIALLNSMLKRYDTSFGDSSC